MTRHGLDPERTLVPRAALPLMLHALGVRTLRFMACDTLDNIDDSALDRSADAIASAVWQLSAPHSQLHR